MEIGAFFQRIPQIDRIRLELKFLILVERVLRILESWQRHETAALSAESHHELPTTNASPESPIQPQIVNASSIFIMDTLRSTLQPLTAQLPAPIADLGVSILGKECYTSLVLNINLEDTTCLKLAISKGLGIGIIAASSIVKVPQILKLLNSKSASGISFLSYLLETSAYLISLAYNVRQGFPFSTYGETGLIMAQNVVIAILVLQYTGRSSTAAAFVAALGTSAFTLFSKNIMGMETLGYFQAGAGVLGIASKLPQILAVYQEGGTGQLSAFAVSSEAIFKMAQY
jgi:mannose-P-dolichol utilization defect protein 1